MDNNLEDISNACVAGGEFTHPGFCKHIFFIFCLLGISRIYEVGNWHTSPPFMKALRKVTIIVTIIRMMIG